MCWPPHACDGTARGTWPRSAATRKRCRTGRRPWTDFRGQPKFACILPLRCTRVYNCVSSATKSALPRALRLAGQSPRIAACKRITGRQGIGKGTCDGTGLKRTYAFARLLAPNSTPTTIFPDGRVQAGMMITAEVARTFTIKSAHSRIVRRTAATSRAGCVTFRF